MPTFRRLMPLYSRVRGRLGRNTRHQDHASRTWTLSPAVQAVAPAAIFEADDLQRITGVHPDDTIAGQIAKARGGPGQHGATVAYELRNVLVSDGNVFTWQVVLPVSGRRPKLLGPGEAVYLESAALASSLYGLRYFGHWIADDLPTLLAARDVAEPISMLTRPLPSQRDYLRLLGLNCRTVSDAWIDRLTVIEDVGQNAFKRARYQRLFEAGLRHTLPTRWSGALLLRGRSGARRVLTNEEDVAALARRRNLVVIDPETTPAEQIMQLCSQVDLVIGVEGSHLYNGLMWMSRTGSLIVIQPPQRFVMVTKDLCDCVGIRTAFIVGHAMNATDFRVDLTALERLCDRVGAPRAV